MHELGPEYLPQQSAPRDDAVHTTVTIGDVTATPRSRTGTVVGNASVCQ